MDIAKALDKLEDKLGTQEPEENREEIIAALSELHLQAGEDVESLNRFVVQVAERFGGIYIPYIFWDKLSDFYEDQEDRAYLFQIIQAFTNSDFDEEEQRLMKSLLITYFAKEKQFELNKIKALIIDKAHPEVQDYFHKLLHFVEKNQRATEMYCQKFELLKNIHPNFELMALPITQLQEKFQNA